MRKGIGLAEKFVEEKSMIAVLILVAWPSDVPQMEDNPPYKEELDDGVPEDFRIENLELRDFFFDGAPQEVSESRQSSSSLRCLSICSIV